MLRSSSGGTLTEIVFFIDWLFLIRESTVKIRNSGLKIHKDGFTGILGEYFGNDDPFLTEGAVVRFLEMRVDASVAGDN
jgi:hypothetical protein